MPLQPYVIVFVITGLLAVVLALYSWHQRRAPGAIAEQRLPEQLLDRRGKALALRIGLLWLVAIVIGGEPYWFSAYVPPALMRVLEVLIPTSAAALGLLLLWQLSERLAATLERMAATNAALRESEIRYRTISDLTTDTIYSLRIGDDGQVELEWVSDSFTSTTGYSQDELRQRDSWLKILHPDDVEIDRQHDAALRAGQSDVCEYRVISKQGQVRWFRDYARPIWDAGQARIVRILGAAQDITDHKRAQAAHHFLAEASGLLGSSLDYETTLVHVARLAIPQLADWCMIHLVDDDYTLRRVALTFADPAKHELAEELQQHYPLALDAPHSFARVIRSGQPELIPEVTDADLQRIARDARHMEILRALGSCSTISVPLIARDRTIGSIMLGTAESNRRYDEYDLQIAEELASRVALVLENARLYSAAQQELAERRRSEAALLGAEAELRAARDHAEAASRAKSEFLAQMSHDMRTPISSALGITELLGQTSLDANQRELVQIIRASGDALLALLNNFLDLAKIESGHLLLDRHPFVLQACIEKTIDVMASKVAAKGLDLAYTLDPDLPAIFFGDQHRLGQILLNLLGNAAKFTESGGILISVAAQPISEAAYEIHFSIADTGIGIAPAQHEQVFNAFQQLHGPAAYASPGIGLGLAIAKQLSELMGGRMWLESTVGVGSTFHFTIVADTPPAQAGDRLVGLANLVGKHLLIIDQHAQSRQALSAYARARGMRVSIAETAQQALAASAPAQPFDVIAADIREASQDPARLAARLREHFGTPKLPIILLAPLGPQDTGAQAGLRSMLLRKPIKLSQLQELLLWLFGQRSGGETDIAQAQPATPAPLVRLPRILLAEDDRANQQLGLRILQKLGLPHTAVTTGAQALAALDERLYDIVLLDIQMPGMSGLETARLIRQRCPQERQPYLIAITASTAADVRAECLKAGINDYLIKPLEISQLQAALAQYDAQAAARAGQPKQLLQHELGTPALAGATAAPAALDPDALDRIRTLLGPQQEKLHALFASYGEDSAALVQQMHAAEAAGDLRMLQQSLHQLKSSSTIVAAIPLANLCTQFEQALSTAEPAGWLAWIERIAAEASEVQHALTHEAQR
jgi:PAS domain S-box-containing protein